LELDEELLVLPRRLLLHSDVAFEESEHRFNVVQPRVIPRELAVLLK
jgi:hypothetical protein